jgi:two-component system, NtrC family, sensor kinase
MKEIRPTRVGTTFIDSLLGLESSKIGFYSEVKQKIQELEAVNLGLRFKQMELQTIFDAISDGVVIYDNKKLVQHRNHVCPQLFPRETLVGTGCRALFHPETRSAPDSCPVEKALAGQNCQWSFTASTEKHDRKQFFEVTATPIENPGGGYRALIFLRDVTQKRMQELNVLQADKMSSIGILAAGVAHEINNPMNSVAGYAEALQRRLKSSPELLDDKRLEDFGPYLDVIIREVYRCKSIIDNLLSFSRKSDGSKGEVNLNAIIREVLQLLQHKSRYESILVRETLAEQLPVMHGDAGALRQVFLNLLLNAMQAISDEGTVEVATRCVPGWLEARVTDTGSGIPAEMIDQIWNPFFTTKTVGKGSGLGLALAYDIVKNHGGEIAVTSTVGQGTEFIVRFPVCQ